MTNSNKTNKITAGDPTIRSLAFPWAEGINKNREKFHPYVLASSWDEDGNYIHPLPHPNLITKQ